jgi:hypothetical protein
MNRFRAVSNTATLLVKPLLSNEDIVGYFAAQDEENDSLRNQLEYMKRSLDQVQQSLEAVAKHLNDTVPNRNIRRVRSDIQSEKNQMEASLDSVRTFKENLNLIYNYDRLKTIGSLHHTSIGQLRFIFYRRPSVFC